MKINYLIGNATYPVGEGNKIIAHIVNTEKRWGKGFVLAISKRWNEPERKYYSWAPPEKMMQHSAPPFKLGNIQTVQVEQDVAVCNMLAQKGLRASDNLVPLNYTALVSCLKELKTTAKKVHASVHMPYVIGCGLGGGNDSVVLKIIEEVFEDSNVEVFMYKLPELSKKM